jgi:hypothetical protein
VERCGPNIEGAEYKYDRGKRVHNSGRPTFPKRHMESLKCFEYETIDDRW